MRINERTEKPSELPLKKTKQKLNLKKKVIIRICALKKSTQAGIYLNKKIRDLQLT